MGDPNVFYACKCNDNVAIFDKNHSKVSQFSGFKLRFTVSLFFWLCKWLYLRETPYFTNIHVLHLHYKVTFISVSYHRYLLHASYISPVYIDTKYLGARYKLLSIYLDFFTDTLAWTLSDRFLICAYSRFDYASDMLQLCFNHIYDIYITHIPHIYHAYTTYLCRYVVCIWMKCEIYILVEFYTWLNHIWSISEP